jgi:hypothetical protein
MQNVDRAIIKLPSVPHVGSYGIYAGFDHPCASAILVRVLAQIGVRRCECSSGERLIQPRYAGERVQYIAPYCCDRFSVAIGIADAQIREVVCLRYTADYYELIAIGVIVGTYRYYSWLPGELRPRKNAVFNDKEVMASRLQGELADL